LGPLAPTLLLRGGGFFLRLLSSKGFGNRGGAGERYQSGKYPFNAEVSNGARTLGLGLASAPHREIRNKPEKYY